MIRSLTLLIYFVAISHPLSMSGQLEAKALFPVIRDDVIEYNSNKVGFIDSNGRLIIDFKFYSASPFSEGLARVKLTKDSKEGYINTNGQMVIEPQYERAFPFIEGRAQVRVDGKWRFIDRHWKTAHSILQRIK